MNEYQKNTLTALVHDLLQDETHPDPGARLYAVKMRIEGAINRMIIIEREKQQKQLNQEGVPRPHDTINPQPQGRCPTF